MFIVYTKHTFEHCILWRQFGIFRYNLIRPGHPSNKKRIDTSLYLIKYFSFRVINIQFQHDWINLLLKVGDKFFCFVPLYRFPTQLKDKFGNFSENSKMILLSLFQNTFLLVVTIKELNDKLKSGYFHNKSNLPFLVLTSDLHHNLIWQLSPKSFPPNINCHHQMIYEKFAFKRSVII